MRKDAPAGNQRKTMFTPRVTRPANPDGTPKPYPQRARERRAADSVRRRDEREKQAQAKREAQFAPPPPKPPTMEQRKAARAAEAEGKRLAELRAAERAAERATEPTNPYRERAHEYGEQAGYRPDAKRRFEHFSRLADQYDREQAEAKAEAERKAAIDADPAVKIARENAGFLAKAAGTEFADEATICAAIAAEGDTRLYWERARELEQKIWAAEDKRKAELAANRAASDAAFLEQAAKADAAKQRLEFAESQTIEP
jgi:hypothetical protein